MKSSQKSGPEAHDPDPPIGYRRGGKSQRSDGSYFFAAAGFTITLATICGCRPQKYS